MKSKWLTFKLNREVYAVFATAQTKLFLTFFVPNDMIYGFKSSILSTHLK